MLTRLLASTVEVSAHCDLPCGVYDPAQARIEAESIKCIIAKVADNNDPDFRVRAILITHTHADHSPLSKWLAERTGAPTYGFGPHGEFEIDPDADVKPEESVDLDFAPSAPTADGDTISGPGWTFEAIHTPGHCSNHLCFALAEESTVFTGDHVMGWSTAVISPPDGDMRAYFASLEKMLARHGDAVYRPTHGGPITDPRPFVEAYLTHRREREQQILDEVRRGPVTVEAIVAILYADVAVELHKPAARSVRSHLLKLIADGLVAEATVAGVESYAAV
jgi:glyoxylase-like metal-dependent hydrolase (beta-lactamase superfamily II)